MKTDLLHQLKQVTSLSERQNIAREHIQFSMLEGLHLCGAFRQLAFVGGTCLRLIHGLARYSEDMDFSVSAQSSEKIDMVKIAKSLAAHLKTSGFDVEVAVKEKVSVMTVSVRIRGLFHEIGLSPLPDQKLLIKMEIDLRPPAGSKEERTIIQKPALASINHYDLPSLMAGKLHALLARPYTKGRDWYDLLWYMNKSILPNVTLLQNALEQRPSQYCQDASQWAAGLNAKLRVIPWDSVRADLAPFLQIPHELEFIAPESFAPLLVRLLAASPTSMGIIKRV